MRQNEHRSDIRKQFDCPQLATLWECPITQSALCSHLHYGHGLWLEYISEIKQPIYMSEAFSIPIRRT